MQLVSYGGFLNYSLLYDAPVDNEDRSVRAHSDIILEVRLHFEVLSCWVVVATVGEALTLVPRETGVPFVSPLPSCSPSPLSPSAPFS